ncbi:hypothetical protein ANN_24292, partial [Periplaneta americana]
LWKVYTFLTSLRARGNVVSIRLRWLGHVVRRDEQSLIKGTWEELGLPDGRGRLGRPRFRWNDQVQRDLERIERNWTMTEDREAWRKIVIEAKNLRFDAPQ